MKMTGMLVGNNLGKVQALEDHPLCVVGVLGRAKS